MLNVLSRPWYRYQPTKIIRRALQCIGSPAKSVVVRLPWNTSIEVDPRETIGRSIWTTGITDLSVCETICRLVEKGDSVIDVGANIGFMTGLMAACVGPQGHVRCFEPNPQVLTLLRSNLSKVEKSIGQKVVLHECAVSDFSGETFLECPVGFGDNHGVASITTDASKGIRVPVVRLDDLKLAENDVITVMKVDVEGHEAGVILGAKNLLEERRIKFLIFEEHRGLDCESFSLLQSFGYQVFRIGWNSNGLVYCPLASKPIHSAYEPANFIATFDRTMLEKPMSELGFRVFSKRYWRQNSQ